MCIIPDGKEDDEGHRLFPVVLSDKRQGAHSEPLGFGIIFMIFLNCQEVMESPGLRPWKHSKPDYTQS